MSPCARCHNRHILSNIAILYSLTALAFGVVILVLAAAKVLGFFG